MSIRARLMTAVAMTVVAVVGFFAIGANTGMLFDDEAGAGPAANLASGVEPVVTASGVFTTIRNYIPPRPHVASADGQPADGRSSGDAAAAGSGSQTPASESSVDATDEPADESDDVSEPEDDGESDDHADEDDPEETGDHENEDVGGDEHEDEDEDREGESGDD